MPTHRYADLPLGRLRGQRIHAVSVGIIRSRPRIQGQREREVNRPKRAQELGFTLAEVEQLLGLADGGPEFCDAARQLAESHIAELERKIADLQGMRASLAKLSTHANGRRRIVSARCWQRWRLTSR